MNKVRSPRKKSKELLPDKATIHSYKSSTAGLLLLRKMQIGYGSTTLQPDFCNLHCMYVGRLVV